MTDASAEASRKPRAFLVRGFGALLALVFLVLSALMAAPAVASPAVPPPSTDAKQCKTDGSGAVGESATNKTPYDAKTLKVEIDEAKLDHKSSENHITMEIRIKNRNGTATCAAYPVFLQFNQPPDERLQDAPGCADVSFNDPAIARGTYHCTAIIEGPGKWTFTATINKPAEPGSIQTVIMTKATTLDFPDVPKLEGGSRGLKYVVEGSTFEVFLLQFHVAMAGLWMLLSAAMAFMAIPRLRRALSVLALHTLEVRRGFLTSSLWATFGGTLITGLYLLGTQTAYDAPFSAKKFSFDSWDKVTNLPYAQSYFLLLYGKIIAFGLMGAASVILMLEAGRQAQMAQDADPMDRDDDDDMWSKPVHFDEEGHVLHDDDVAVAGGATASVTRTAVKAQRRSSTSAAGVSQQTLWICVLILVGGAMAIGGAVTGLKYLHELIESANAVGIIRSELGG